MKPTLSILSMLALMTFMTSLPASASYYIEGDDSERFFSQTELPEKKDAAATDYSFHVPFTASSYNLNGMGKKSLSSILQELKKAPKLLVQGRPDPTDLDNTDLAMRRALSIRKWLLQKGIRSSKMELQIVRQPIFTDAANLYASSVLTLPSPASSNDEEPPVFLVKNSNTPEKPETDETAHLLQLAAKNKLSPQQAIALLQQLEGSNVSQETPTSPVTRPQTASGQPAAQWALDDTATLQENLESWTRQAGWSLNWQVSRNYQVNRAVLEGSFQSALKAVSEAAGINICAASATKSLTVTDLDKPCR